MDALTIKDEDEWQQSAPGRPPDDPTTLQRLLAATASPAAWTSYESITEALKSLLSLGFVVEQQQESPSPATELAHFITTTLLNFGLRHGSPSSFRFSLLLGEQTLHIPSRSQLLLLHLSRLLSINIFIFSSRTKPKAYIQSGSKSSVAFFHRIDSFYNTSEFCVLAFARHVNPGLNLAPLVQAPTNFSSPIRAAVFREGPRVTQRASNTDSASPDIEVCKEALRSVCMDRLGRDLKLEVSKILNKKKFKAGETKENIEFRP
ncbi:hypothetical protein B0O80DRAFT_180206 [Mortierella sp. GBAus27b]|nr:hypothetical protein B0O80DRAFT_180206 [Mortierella sp. GBAus27b]